MLARKLLTSQSIVALTTLWSDTFTEGVNTNIASHTPDVGTSYSSTKTLLNATIQDALPDARVSAATDFLTYFNTARGPFFNVSTIQKEISYLIVDHPGGNLTTAVRCSLSPSNSMGWYVQITTTAINIYRAGAVLIATVGISSPAGKVFKITDDGGNTTTSLNFYLDDSLVLTASAVDVVASTGRYSIGISLGSSGISIDNLVVKGVSI